MASRNSSEVDRFKQGFFDRGLIISAMDQATRKAMVSTGAYTRTVARNSMKKRKGPSDPMTPPHVHVGTLKNLLYFNYDPQARTVVVGPVGLGNSKVPGILEYGNKFVEPRPYMAPAGNKAYKKFAGKVRFTFSTSTT